MQLFAKIVEGTDSDDEMSADVFLKIMFVLFVTCYLAEIIGVSALIGAFQVLPVVAGQSVNF